MGPPQVEYRHLVLIDLCLIALNAMLDFPITIGAVRSAVELALFVLFPRGARGLFDSWLSCRQLELLRSCGEKD